MSDHLRDRNPGCNVWMPTSGGWGCRCGDLDIGATVHLCASCAAQVPPEQPGEREALIAEWVSMLEAEGCRSSVGREHTIAALRAAAPPIAGLRALVHRNRPGRPA